jgi:hypothetical protein
MTDEQTIIYLSPEEELTSVRERLERTQARRITLIIPQQTQLRSHVGWRLIHARMRELGKELLVISPDRQVRAVARAAGFRVAETQESPSSRPRTGSSTRPGSTPTRGSARSRVGGSRGGPESQVPQQSGSQRRPTPASSKRPMVPPTPIQADYEDENTLERPRQRGLKADSNQPVAPATLFEKPESQFGPSYDFHINTTPSVRPSVPHLEDEDEEEDLQYYDDYTAAQRIRESAREGTSKAEEQPKAAESRASKASRWGVDPYAYLEDEPPRSPLPEQRGSLRSSSPDIGTGVPDISDNSTEIMESEIEDLGDMGAIDLPAIEQAPQPQRPSQRLREQEARPRTRTGQMQSPARRSPRAPRPGSEDFNDDEDLLALPNRPAQARSQPLRPSRGLASATQNPRPSRGLASANPRQSQTLAPGAGPQAGARGRVAPTPLPSAQRAPNRQLLPPPSTPPRQAAGLLRKSRGNNRGLTIVSAVLILLLIVAGLLFYLVPTATVTISLQTQAFSQTVHLNATTDPHANAQGNVRAQRLQDTFSTSGQGTASGTTRVGNARAQGLVTFTNNGSADVTIPTGTIIATASGLQFSTGAEAVIPANSNFPAVPVSAQQAGDSGNVPANSIAMIPSASMSSIAQYNHTSSANINLAVNNPQSTSGGGATNVPAVTTQDLQALTRTLHKKLQQEVTSWLGQQIHTGDLRGTLVPDILGHAGPLPEEQLSGAPGAGQAATGGTFSGTLALHVSVLVARAVDLQKAADAQLNAAALKLRQPSVLATQLPVTLTNTQGTSSQNGNILAITAQASGEIYRQIPVQDISSSLTGKGVVQAKSDLQNSMAQAGIQNVQISVLPTFLSILPLRADNIHIILRPVQQTSPQHVPNG